MEKKMKKSDCCSCEADFKKEIQNMENEAKEPSKAMHDQKLREVDSAFKSGEKKQKK